MARKKRFPYPIAVRELGRTFAVQHNGPRPGASPARHGVTFLVSILRGQARCDCMGKKPCEHLKAVNITLRKQLARSAR